MFDWSLLAVRDAIECAVAGAMPTLDMASPDGDAHDWQGRASVHVAHVLRFEYQ